MAGLSKVENFRAVGGGVPQGPKKLWGGWGGAGEALAGCHALETACSPPISGPEVGGNFRHMAGWRKNWTSTVNWLPGGRFGCFLVLGWF